MIYYTSIRRHLDYTSARLRRAVKVSSLFFDRFTDLKTEKNGGFRADPLAKYHRFLFFGILFKHFRKILYAKIRHVQPSYWRCRIHISRFSSYIIIGTDVSLFYNSLYAQPFLLAVVFNIPLPIKHVIP